MSEQTASTSIQVVDRLVNLLDYIARYDEPVLLKVLAADTGLHPSTAFRILSSLQQHELVEREPGGGYILGRHLLRLANRVSKKLDVAAEAKPIMNWLRDQVGETVNLTMRQGDEVVYIERSLSRRMMRVEHLIGSHAPLHVTAVGKLMLGSSGDEAIAEYAQRTGLPAYTDNTITSIEELQQKSKSAMTRGYALDNEEAEQGVGCLGVLVMDESNNKIYGMSISAPIERRRDEWIPLLQEAGRRLSNRLGSKAN